MKDRHIIRTRTLLNYLLLATIAVVIMNSCVSIKKTKLLQEEGATSYMQGTSAGEYKLKTGDQIYIKVYSVDPKTSRLFQTDMPQHFTSTTKELNSYKIDKDGYIHFSFIEKMMLKGKTLEEATQLLQDKINEYFKEATVVVKLAYFRVSVLGEVKKPGTFNVEEKEINILQALAEVGGIETFGNREKVMLIRKEQVHYLDIREKSILQSEYFNLMPNDVIYVEPRSSKNISLEKLPYGVMLSIISLSVAAYSIFGN